MLYQESQLYEVRNIGSDQRATAKAVADAGSLIVTVSQQSIGNMKEAMDIEDLRKTSQRIVNAHRMFYPEFETMLSGKHAAWMLWRVRVWRDRIEFDFYDLLNKNMRQRETTSLLCTVPWEKTVDITITVDENTVLGSEDLRGLALHYDKVEHDSILEAWYNIGDRAFHEIFKKTVESE